MWNVLAALPLCLVVSLASAQTAPNGQLSPGFSACEPPTRLSEFYGVGGDWKIARIHMNGNYLVLVGQYVGPKQNPTDPDLYPIWVQDLGPDGQLTATDFDIGVTTRYIATLDHLPIVSISKSGMLAFIARDPTTAGREFPDPNWSGPGPAPMLPAPQDEVLFTCFYLDCVSTVQEARRFMPIYHLTYTSPPYTYMQLDGSVTNMHWESFPGGGFGSEFLVYSFVHYLNTLVQSPPWLAQAPSPMPPVRLPHTGIDKFEPWSGSAIPVARQTTGSTLNDGSSFVLTKSAQTRLPSMNWPRYLAYFSTGTLSLQGGVYQMDAYELTEDTSGGPVWGSLNPITAWIDGPSSGVWAGQWRSGPDLSVLGEASSSANGYESVAVRTTFEAGSTSRRDAVFRSSANNFGGIDLPITPINDNRDVKGVFAMDGSNFRVAVETWPLNNNNQRRTQIYEYQPSSVPGQVGTFTPYKEVHVSASNQVFYLFGATSEHAWGTHDDYSLPPTRVRDWAIARCP